MLGLAFAGAALALTAVAPPEPAELRAKDIRAARLYATHDLGIVSVADGDLDAVMPWRYRGSTVAYWLLVYQQTDRAVASSQDGTFFSDGGGIGGVLVQIGACSLMRHLPGVPRMAKMLVVAACWVGAFVNHLERGALDYQSRVYGCLRDHGIGFEQILGWSDERQERVVQAILDAVGELRRGALSPLGPPLAQLR